MEEKRKRGRPTNVERARRAASAIGVLPSAPVVPVESVVKAGVGAPPAPAPAAPRPSPPVGLRAAVQMLVAKAKMAAAPPPAPEAETSGKRKYSKRASAEKDPLPPELEGDSGLAILADVYNLPWEIWTAESGADLNLPADRKFKGAAALRVCLREYGGEFLRYYPLILLACRLVSDGFYGWRTLQKAEVEKARLASAATKPPAAA